MYINNHTKIEVKCNECGDVFMPTPDNLLHHHGCPVCAGVKKMTKEMFLKRAREIHGDKYDYSKVVWIDKFTDIIITCPIHGDFIIKEYSRFILIAVCVILFACLGAAVFLHPLLTGVFIKK